MIQFEETMKFIQDGGEPGSRYHLQGALKLEVFKLRDESMNPCGSGA
jgi:hypothetical protein